MSTKSVVQCGDCADGWINDGPKGCKKAGNQVDLDLVVRVGAVMCYLVCWAERGLPYEGHATPERPLGPFTH